MSFKRMAELFQANPGALPSDIAESSRTEAMRAWIGDHFRQKVGRFGVRIHRAGEYPKGLRDARHPVEVLTYRGYWNWVESPCIAIVGTREPSEAGVKRARQLVRNLVHDGYTIVSGLARGIDTAAHTAALELGAPTIAVLGTPLSEHYPRENAALRQAFAGPAISWGPDREGLRRSPRVETPSAAHLARLRTRPR